MAFDELNFSTKTVIVEIFPSYYFRLSKIKPEKKVGYTIENINKSLEFFNSKPLKKNQIIGGPDQDDADSIISSAALRFLSTDKKFGMFQIHQERGMDFWCIDKYNLK